MDYYGFVQLALSLVASIIAALGKKNLTEAALIVRRLAAAALRASAEIDAVPVDWDNPKSVADYVRSLPKFEPLP